MKNTTLAPQQICQERWICQNGGCDRSYNVLVTHGKPLDVLTLKQNVTKNLEQYVDAFLQGDEKFVRSFSDQDYELVEGCPVCGEEVKFPIEIFEVNGFSYQACPHCTHIFIKRRLAQKALDEFYANNRGYQTVFMDRATLETRVDQVAKPKAKYVVEQFVRLYGHPPKRVLDIGAGSGHFVYACRNLGLEADGLEISDAGRKFAKDNFAIDMINRDFFSEHDSFNDYDVITFWGVVEHFAEPRQPLHRASEILTRKSSMVVAEVPKWNCLTTDVQKEFSTTIIRHLAPSVGHINVFTEQSLATLFVRSKLDIVGCWNYGMDAYELLFQIGYKRRDDALLFDMHKLIAALQCSVDLVGYSDQITMVGVPAREDY